jgi:hypothetical protein
MIEHRYDAHALIMPGEYAGIVHGRAGLLRLVLSDDGPLTDARTGHEHTQPDVFCHLTARQARRLADQLHQLADQLPIAITTPRPTA